jgi:hypothetical protein
VPSKLLVIRVSGDHPVVVICRELVTSPGHAAAGSATAGRFQEGYDRVSDDVRGPQGQVMSGAFDQPQLAMGQSLRQLAGGAKRNEPVRRVSEQGRAAGLAAG